MYNQDFSRGGPRIDQYEQALAEQSFYQAFPILFRLQLVHRE